MANITSDSWDQNKKLEPICYPLTQLEAAQSLEQAWITLLGYKPSIDCLAILFAQFGLETGYGKFAHCYGYGNIKSSPNDGYFWSEFTCNEIIDGKTVYYSPPSIYCRFRAFKTPYDGAINYIGFLLQKKGYANAWAEVIKGDPVNFCAQLKASHYFTADLSEYTRGVVSICNAFKAKYSNIDLSTHVTPANDIPIPLFTSDEISHIDGQVALSLSRSADEEVKTDDVDFDGLNDVNAPIPMPQTVWNSLSNLFFKGKK
jgi:hypothetical protein